MGLDHWYCIHPHPKVLQRMQGWERLLSNIIPWSTAGLFISWVRQEEQSKNFHLDSFYLFFILNTSKNLKFW